MKNFVSAIVMLCLGALVASCDLQPKITALPDSVGDFISARYPALLADPDTEPEIYNSAVMDYGIYTSPELYGSDGMDDYVNYVDVGDYVLSGDVDDAIRVQINDTDDDVTSMTESGVAESRSDVPDDLLVVPGYVVDELNVPVRAMAGTVVVRRGDTLYSIARENNTTITELARANNINPPYTIKVGQTLKLKSATEPRPIEPKPIIAKPVQQTKTKTQETKVEQNNIEKPAPEKPKPADVRVPVKTITVARGDTLYSLSRAYSVPVNDLAVINKLTAPFALNADQKLRVPDSPVVKSNASENVATKTVTGNTKSAAMTKRATVQTKPTTDKSKGATKSVANNKAPVPATGKTSKAQSAKTESKKPAQKQQAAQGKSAANAAPTKAATNTKTEMQKIPARSASRFTWPVRGTILSHYGAKSGGLYNDGINIGAADGAAVVAAENGIVAYAGNEVRGMGNLIIIQHADGWMTVYGHLKSMNVRMGARVAVGQKIGAVGKTGKVSKPQLHFEIRKGTKAYNPTNYLKK